MTKELQEELKSLIEAQTKINDTLLANERDLLEGLKSLVERIELLEHELFHKKKLN